MNVQLQNQHFIEHLCCKDNTLFVYKQIFFQKNEIFFFETQDSSFPGDRNFALRIPGLRPGDQDVGLRLPQPTPYGVFTNPSMKSGAYAPDYQGVTPNGVLAPLRVAPFGSISFRSGRRLCIFRGRPAPSACLLPMSEQSRTPGHRQAGGRGEFG